MGKKSKMKTDLNEIALTQITKGLEDVGTDIELADPANAIPIEQIKGDIARQGHPVMRVLALDPDAGRLFFQDMQDNALFAEFAGQDEGFRLLRIGFQAEITQDYDPNVMQSIQKRKDYDPTELDAEPRDTVENEHDEEDWDREPGQAGPTPNPTTIDDVREKALISLKKVLGK